MYVRIDNKPLKEKGNDSRLTSTSIKHYKISLISRVWYLYINRQTKTNKSKSKLKYICNFNI